MRFGVMLIGPYEVEMAPAEIYERSLLQARAAVANNFDVLFAAQHYLSGPAAAMMQPLVLLAIWPLKPRAGFIPAPTPPPGGRGGADRHLRHHFRREVPVRIGTGIPGPRVSVIWGPETGPAAEDGRGNPKATVRRKRRLRRRVRQAGGCGHRSKADTATGPAHICRGRSA